MNYAGFASPVHHWLADELVVIAHGTGEVARLPPTPTADLVATLTAFRASAPWALARNQYDLIGSHDTPRIRTLLGGEDGRLRAAFGLLLTDVGVPGLFYGDEVGLEGADGQAARATMPWDERAWDQALFEHVRALARLRRSSRALRDGGHQVLEIRDESLAFLRDTDDEQVVVVVVRGPGPRPDEALRVAHGAIPDGVPFESVLTGATAVVEGGHLRIGATPPGVAVWVARLPDGGGT
jgi:alpha-glucosidase